MSKARVIREMFEANASAGMAVARDFLHEDVVVHVPGRSAIAGDWKGRDQALALADKRLEMTGNTIRVTVHDVTESDEHAVAILLVEAERDGKAYSYREARVFHVEDDKIAEVFLCTFDQDQADELFR